MIEPKEYGYALFMLAEEDGAVEEVNRDAICLNQALLDNPEYFKLLDTPAVAKEERDGLIDAALSQLNPNLINLVKMLADSHRAHVLGKVLTAFFEAYDEKTGKTRVEAISARPLDDGDQSVLEIIKNTSAIKICLINKCEENGLLGEEAIPDIFNTTLHVSLKTEPNLAREQLAGVLDGLFTEEKLLIGTQAVISSSRQHSAARRALEFITTAIEAYNSGLPADYASSDIELALGAIAELDGRAVSGEVVDGIFKSFCVGK